MGAPGQHGDIDEWSIRLRTWASMTQVRRQVGSFSRRVIQVNATLRHRHRGAHRARLCSTTILTKLVALRYFTSGHRRLVSLITDIHALGIAEGAVLIPRASGVLDLIRDAALPILHTGLQPPAATSEAHSA
jgi:hypothetical protein